MTKKPVKSSVEKIPFELKKIGTNRYDLQILNAIRQMIRAADIDSRKLAAEYEITSPQLVSLMAITEMKTATAVEVAKQVHLSPSTLVGILDRLEGKNLIQRERNADDRREVRILPTDQGRAVCAKTPFPLQFALDKALKQLTEKERVQIADWLDRLVTLMGADQINTGPMLEIVSISKREAK